MKRTNIKVIGVMMTVFGALLAADLAAQTRPAPPASPATDAQRRPAGAPAPVREPALDDWKSLRFPPLRPLRIPEIKRFTLANGLQLLVLEDHRVPLINGRLLFRAGKRWDPAGKEGLGAVTALMLQAGGTRTKTSSQIAMELDVIPASLNVFMDAATGVATFSCLKFDEERLLALLVEVLSTPEFRADGLARVKGGVLTQLRLRDSNVDELGPFELAKLIYGAASPYAKDAASASVQALTREDLLEAHRRFVHPSRMILGIWGDVNGEEIRDKVEAAFASWKTPPPPELPALPEASPTRRASLNFVRKENLTQTSMFVGHLGGKRSDPDFLALSVMAEILGRGFAGRMWRHLRTELGIAYRVRAFWNAEYDYPGAFIAMVQTRPENTAKAIDALMQELHEMREKPITEEEVRAAKERLLSEFIQDLAGPDRLMTRVLADTYFGYPADSLAAYRPALEKVTRDDVQKATRTHLRPDLASILVLGNDKKFDRTEVQLAASTWAKSGGQEQESSRLTEQQVISLLERGVHPSRAAALVEEKGVDFALTPDLQRRLRALGANDRLLTAIQKSKAG